jgi:ribosomal protein S14
MSKYRKEWASNPDNRRKRKLRTKYGLTLKCYDKMLKEQDNKCKICGSEETRNVKYEFLCVDHCHETGKVRGLLCDFCNVGLGRFEDDIERLGSAIKYLKETK